MTLDASAPTFHALGVPASISDALAERGIEAPFAIQSATIADSLAGRDVCGRAPTGSGKTLAFGVPLVANLLDERRSAPGSPQALVLAPTRELADQITAELRSFSGKVRVAAVYGGVGYGAQLNALRRGVDILVACPGRLEDLIQRRDVDLKSVRYVVIDEADRMADMGFLPVVRRLLNLTADDRQTVLFSATLDGDVAKLTADYQRDPVRHEVGEETPDVRSATHKFWTLDRLDRNNVVADVVRIAWPSAVFVRTRHGADRLARQLEKLGVAAAPIHGNRSQNQRNRALADFTDGKVQALVATDVAARGIHVDGVASVIHYDPPEDHKAYIHRSGRTARAGADGLVVSLVQPEQKRDVAKMQKQIGLDEPFTDPDIASIGGEAVMSAVKARPASQNTPRDTDASSPSRSGQGKNRSHNGRRGGSSRNGGGHRKGGQHAKSGQRRSGGESRGDGHDNGSKTANNSSKQRSGSNRKSRRAHLQPGS